MQASHLRELSISRKPESRPLAFNNFLASFLQLWMYCSTLPAKACWTRRAPGWLLARLAGLATISNFSSLAIRHSAFTVYLADPLFSTSSSLRSAVMNLRSLSPRLAPLSSGFWVLTPDSRLLFVCLSLVTCHLPRYLTSLAHLTHKFKTTGCPSRLPDSSPSPLRSPPNHCGGVSRQTTALPAGGHASSTAVRYPGEQNERDARTIWYIPTLCLKVSGRTQLVLTCFLEVTSYATRAPLRFRPCTMRNFYSSSCRRVSPPGATGVKGHGEVELLPTKPVFPNHA